MKVIKRDKTEEKFSKTKIKTALQRAFKSSKTKFTKETYEYVLNNIDKTYKSYETDVLNIGAIQDCIEESLAELGYGNVTKTFILYRNEHDRIREFVKKKEEFIEYYKTSFNTADATVDDNSNVGLKNIGILNNEIHKPDNIQINRKMVTNKLKDLYPTFDSKQYIRDLNNHIIYKHDESSFAGAISPYCSSVSLYPFLINGMKDIGGLSAAPKNIDSFCGIFINLVYAISSNFAGALATSEFFTYFTHFCEKEWGKDFYLHTNQPITSYGNRDKTIISQIHQYWQNVIYSINQPTAARGMQSAFVNFSYFDKPFFEGMFGDFIFPDGESPTWESVNWIQREFMQWFNNERLKCMLTFPVESFALVYKDGEFLDKDSADFVATEYERGHSFFTYISDTVDSLSSCCFGGDEEITIYNDGVATNMTLKEFSEKYNINASQKIDTNSQIESFDNKANACGLTNITGIVKKYYKGKLYEFSDGEKVKRVTGDHLLLVKNKTTNEIETITAEMVYKNVNNYLIPIE